MPSEAVVPPRAGPAWPAQPGPNDDAFAVRYYLRLRIVTARGQAYWNTVELRLWRRVFGDVVKGSLSV